MTNTIPAADLSNSGKIRVSGKDAEAVLHNVLTNDIKKLVPGTHCPAALLINTGKIQFYAEAFRFENYFLLVLEHQDAARGITLLDRYIITEDVTLTDVTGEFSYFQAFDAKAEKFLCLKDQAGAFIKQHGFEILPEEKWEPLRIKAGIPRYGKDMDENTILSETGLDKIAVSGTKGCYPGQEVVARIETYKGLTKKLTGFSWEGNEVPAAGDKIFAEGQEAGIGWITSAAPGRALGYLLKGWFDEERSVKIVGQQTIFFKVRSRPLCPS